MFKKKKESANELEKVERKEQIKQINFSFIV